MAGLRVGYGAASLVNDSMNSQAFGEIGFVGERLYDGSGTSMTGFSVRVRAPGYIIPDGIFMMPIAAATNGNCAWCVQWAAKDAAGGMWHLWRSFRITGRLNAQFSALRDATLTVYRNQPKDGRHRNELLLPAVTLRYFWPVSGSTWAQSTDIYLDVGPSLTFGTDRSRDAPWWGAFVSLSASPRVFLP
jgi:hypothetical protein